jgi:hypothetical protein
MSSTDPKLVRYSHELAAYTMQQWNAARLSAHGKNIRYNQEQLDGAKTQGQVSDTLVKYANLASPGREPLWILESKMEKLRQYETCK